ncbi:MAG: ABC transporter substrate-binding protein [Ktedonobacteraceae bacterium]|nr:ABC transporter substrate-binding protein [Chloroflexota bacterium]
MECPNCGTDNRPGVRYCNNCGKALPVVTSGGNATSAGRSLAPGTRLQGGRYDIKKVLGEGGMGAALLAVDNRLDDKRVVIKELLSDHTDPAARQDDVRNFKREVTMLAHLDHPLIPNVTDNFQEGARYFMVQEYVEGENLEEFLNRNNQPMRERDALIYADQLLDILDYLEQQTPPIVHRDIKPANIIIGAKDKRAHLVDFGIARADVARNAQKRQTSALGTPGYAPPEQYQGNADPRSDLYALAATLHHVLTNRDPRNHPPFAYPPAHTLNPQVSPDVERVLNRALSSDVNQRYQSAAAMKRDIDDILLKRYGVSGDLGSYTLSTSGPMGMLVPGFASAPTQVQQAPPPPGALAFNPQPGNAWSPPLQPLNAYSPPPPRRRGSSGRNLLLLVLVVLLVVAGIVIALPYLRSRPGGPASTPAVTITPPASALKNGIGAYQVTDKQTGYKEYIGVSDGSVAFDTNRVDGNTKQQAAARLKEGDVGSAQTLWQSAIAGDTNDAEVLIYQEDQHVLASGSSYITLVVGTMLTSNDSGVVGTGRDDLQGAYVAQKEYNSGFKLGGGMQVRLLIANSGSSGNYANAVAQQIVEAAQADPTIVGVMGWPYSGRTQNVVRTLANAHLPMVSETASSDLLDSASPYFFRVCPSNKHQGILGANYATHNLNSKKLALFVDPVDSYSKSLADDFSAQYRANGGTILVTEQYTVGKPATLQGELQDALNHNPDLIYFSGYASDISTLLVNLPTSGQFAQLQILGGDALYELGGYPPSARAGFTRLHFTTFAYPDEWSFLRQGARQPGFFAAYPQAFNPGGQHSGYGYTRPDNDVMLSYDATLALLEGSRIALAGGKHSFTGNDLRQALASITGTHSIQGVSGQIAFGPDGNPAGKAVVILLVNGQGFTQIESVQGQFLKTS